MQLTIKLDLTSQDRQNRLLEGLDNWVRLGLLSEAQVLELAQSMSRTIPLADDQLVSSSLPPFVNKAVNRATNQAANRALFESSPTAAEAISASAEIFPETRTPPSASRISQVMRSLLEEISIIWLLFLGVFLVVVSSGVLAASQWESFSAVGQYAILLAYTLVFWGSSVWAKQQERLQATAKMLALTATLLIPINFWMIDALGVWRSSVGIGVGALSTLLLSSLLLKLLSQRSNQLNLIGLSWLHLGWLGGWAVWPVVATYLATIGTAANLNYRLSHPEQQSNAVSVTENSLESAGSRLLSFDRLAVLLSVVVLLFRSLLIVQVPPYELGLAAGICGWLLVSLTRNRSNLALANQTPVNQTSANQTPINQTPANQNLGQWVGFGLLLVGWAVSADRQPPLQALSISGLALWLIWQQITSTWKKEPLLALIAVAGQAYWLLGKLVPTETREAVLGQLSQRFSEQPISSGEWIGLGFFPFLLGLLLFARQLRRWQQPALSKVTTLLALALGGWLTIVSAGNAFTLALNLLLSAVTLFVVVSRRPRISSVVVTLTHVTGLLAVAAWINYLRPDLTGVAWFYVMLGAALAELMLPLLLVSDRWRKNTWGMSFCLFAGSYVLLLNSWLLGDNWSRANRLINLSSGISENLSPDWIWLIVPVALTLVAHHRRALHPTRLAQATMLAAVLQTPWLGTGWSVAIASFTVGTFCMLINSRIWRSQWAALFTIGSGIAWVTSIVWYGLLRLGVTENYLLIHWAVEIWALWLLARLLVRQRGDLSALYQRAAQVWGGVLLTLLLLLGTLVAGSNLWALVGGNANVSENRYTLAAIILLIATLIESIRYRPAEWRYWSLAWATAIAVVISFRLWDWPIESVGIAFLALGLITQIAGDIWMLRRSPTRLSWHGIPLMYAGLGVILGHSATLQADSGLYTLVFGLILLGLGRRSVSSPTLLSRGQQEALNEIPSEVSNESPQQSPQNSLSFLSYLGLAAFSWGAYELLIYRLMQASGGQPGDGFTLLAGLALALAVLQKLLGPGLIRYFRVPAFGLRSLSQIHWFLGSGLAVSAALLELSQPAGIALWIAIALGLAAYALVTGNHRWTPQMVGLSHSAWTSLGLVEILLCAAYSRFAWFPDRTFLIAWGGLIACGVSTVVYQLPWQRWGWPQRPWRSLALWLPLTALIVALNVQVPTQTLLIVGAFYAWMAKQCDRVRLSYMSVWLLDWVLLRNVYHQGWLTALMAGALPLASIVGFSVLYVAQVDPCFDEVSKKQQRHWLRSLATVLVCLSALYQAETYRPMLLYAGITLALCTGLIFAGLALKVRAFLYVGTSVFVLQVIRVLWLFISANSLLLWAAGIVLGLAFIWVAATFESRRSQVTQRLEAWTSALATWD